LLALICLNLNTELLDLLLMFALSTVKLFNIVKVKSLSFYAAHLFPDTEALVGHLLVKRGAASDKELFGELIPFNIQTP